MTIILLLIICHKNCDRTRHVRPRQAAEPGGDTGFVPFSLAFGKVHTMTNFASPSRHLNRRAFLTMVAVAGGAGLCWQLGILDKPLAAVRRSQPIMGTYLNLTVYGRDRDACERAIDATINRMLALEGQLSRHQETSPLALLNRTGELASPSREMLEVLTLSRELSDRSEGAFDVTMLPLLTLHAQQPQPAADRLERARAGVDYRQLMVTKQQIRFARPDMGVTLDGIAKGYIVDQGVAALHAEGFSQVYVDAGGDLMVTGAKPDGSPWRIGIMNPRKGSPAKPVTVGVTSKAVATSGDYFQAFTPDLLNHHIIDPHTGFSSPELASCTVTAPTVALADGLATAVMVLGREKGLELLETMDGCEGYLIDKQLNSSHTSNFFS